MSFGAARLSSASNKVLTHVKIFSYYEFSPGGGGNKVADKKCPRCGLWNRSVALRCDCGYDFETNRVGISFTRQEVPFSIAVIHKFFLFQLVVVIISVLFIGLSSGELTYTLLILIFLFLYALSHQALYKKVLKKKIWALYVFAWVCAPVGLILLFSKEVQLFMMQLENQ